MYPIIIGTATHFYHTKRCHHLAATGRTTTHSIMAGTTAHRISFHHDRSASPHYYCHYKHFEHHKYSPQTTSRGCNESSDMISSKQPHHVSTIQGRPKSLYSFPRAKGVSLRYGEIQKRFAKRPYLSGSFSYSTADSNGVQDVV